MIACLGILNVTKEKAWRKMVSMPHAGKNSDMTVTANDGSAAMFRGAVLGLPYCQ